MGTTAYRPNDTRQYHGTFAGHCDHCGARLTWVDHTAPSTTITVDRTELGGHEHPVTLTLIHR